MHINDEIGRARTNLYVAVQEFASTHSVRQLLKDTMIIRNDIVDAAYKAHKEHNEGKGRE